MNIVRDAIKWMLVFSAVLIVQATIMPKFAIVGIYPNLVLIALFVLAIQKGSLAGIWSGFFVGLLIDTYSSGVFGINSLANTVVGGAVGLFEKKNIAVESSVKFFILLLAVIVHDTFLYVPNLYKADESINQLFKFLAFSSLPRAIYTVFAAILMLFAFEYFSSLKSRR